MKVYTAVQVAAYHEGGPSVARMTSYTRVPDRLMIHTGLRRANLTVPLALVGSLVLGGFSATFVRDPEIGMRVFLFFGAAVVLATSVMALREGNGLGAFIGFYLVSRHLIGRSVPFGGDINNYGGILVSAVLLLYAARVMIPPRDLIRHAAFWTGPAPWGVATIAGLLAGNLTLVVGRGVGLSVPLAGLLLARRDPQRTMAGLVAAGGIMISTALYAGCVAPETALDGRLGGGEFWHTHPNLLAMFCALFAIAWLYLPTHRALRWLVIPVLLGVILYTGSRTALGAFGIGWLLGFPSTRVRIAVVALGGTVLLFGAASMFLSARAEDSGGVLTGRTEIWDVAMNTWSEAAPLAKLIGPADTIDGMVELVDGRVFVAHSAFYGTLLRSGVIGVLCLIFGGVLFLRRTRFMLLNVPPGAAQAGLAAIGVGIATFYTEDWLTNDIVWWMMALGELIILRTGLRSAAPIPDPKSELDTTPSPQTVPA